MLARLLVPAFAVVALTGCTLAPQSASQAPAPGATPSQALAARIVAVGIPGAAGITPVGQFHAGGPIHDKPNFAVSTQPGAMLDPERVLVTSSSNFGLPRARDDQATGAVLSIDPRGASPLVVPPTFAAGGGQASALNGAVLMFTAQSPAFLNSLTKPGAVTADQPGTSSPVGISINNAFGRVWLANTPMGPSGMGSETIIDPDGRPLADAPSERAGGVFAGAMTNRTGQVVPGALNTGVVGNALLGRSPDGSTKAVFAVVSADGSVAQVHAAQGVDGLAPAGTIKPVRTRTGMAFNWTPDRILYVANRANGTLVRMRQDGHVVAVRTVQVPGLGDLGADKLNGIAVSPDASKIWLTVSSGLPAYADAVGAVLEVPAFK